MSNTQQSQSPTPELKPNEVQAFKDGALNLNWRDYLPLGPNGKPIKFDDVPACCTCIREELAEMEGIETDGNGQRVKRGLFSGLFGGKPSTGKGSNGGGRMAALGDALANIDWQRVFRVAVVAVNVGAVIYALSKIGLAFDIGGATYAVVTAGTTAFYLLFFAAFAVVMVKRHDIPALLATGMALLAAFVI